MTSTDGFRNGGKQSIRRNRKNIERADQERLKVLCGRPLPDRARDFPALRGLRDAQGEIRLGSRSLSLVNDAEDLAAILKVPPLSGLRGVRLHPLERKIADPDARIGTMPPCATELVGFRDQGHKLLVKFPDPT